MLWWLTQNLRTALRFLTITLPKLSLLGHQGSQARSLVAGSLPKGTGQTW